MFTQILIIISVFVLITLQSESDNTIPIGFPVPAKCETEMQVVQFKHKQLRNNRELYPGCTRVPQCSGCCSNKKSCLPIKTRKIAYSVKLINSFTQGTIRNVTVEVEEHLDCECQCKQTAKDCHYNQYFNAKKCSCDCNRIAKRKCENQIRDDPHLLIWNEETCSCDCIDNCTTGTHLNGQCECVDDD